MGSEALEPLIIYFKISDKDYLQSMMRVGRKKAIYYAIEVAWMAAALAVVVYLQVRSESTPAVLAFTALPAVVFAFALYQLLIPIPARFRVQKGPRVMKPGLWTFSQRGVSWKGKPGWESFDWDDFGKFYEKKEYFYFFFAEAPSRYLLFPKLQFASEEEVERFRRLCSRNIGRA